jgi:DNA-binding NarL/FixJ family response regulator
MMERVAMKHRANVKIVIADSDMYTCQGLRNALADDGYGDVRAVGRLAVLRDILMTAVVDLLVLDIDLPDGDAIALARDIRRGKIGRNPFLPIILLTWASAPEVVLRVVSSGVDLILVKPLSTGQLFSRIEGLIADRKPFVVTADYMGPDRRSREMSENTQFYNVPNTLKDKIEGRPVDPTALSTEINAALQAMNNSRMAQAGLKLAGAIDGLCRRFESKATEDIYDEIARIGHLVRDIAGLGGPDIRTLCKSLIKTLNQIGDNADTVDAKQIELLRPLSHSILLAANPDLSLHPVMDEINRALSALSPKQAAAGKGRTTEEVAD